MPSGRHDCGIAVPWTIAKANNRIINFFMVTVLGLRLRKLSIRYSAFGIFDFIFYGT
jgi:hypothetical protein